VQGTPDGPAIQHADVEIDLLHRGVAIKNLTAKLDEFGVVVLDDLPVAMGVQPLVRVHYAGVTFQQIGTLMDSANPTPKIEVHCYEVTHDRPDWSIHMRHVMVTHADDGARVTEIVIINNPAKRTWLGHAIGDQRPVTTSLGLPDGATDVQLGRGFHDWCCSTLEGSRLSNHLPLMPGPTEMTFSYALPSSSGTALLRVDSPVRVDQLTLTVPADMRTPTLEGLELGGETKIADTFVRYYTAENVPAGTLTSATLEGLRFSHLVTSATDERDAAETPRSAARYVAAVGGGLILLAAIVLIVFRAPKATPEA
jgi:hypothetical protein